MSSLLVLVTVVLQQSCDRHLACLPLDPEMKDFTKRQPIILSCIILDHFSFFLAYVVHLVFKVRDTRNNPKITSQSHVTCTGDYLEDNTVFRQFDGIWIPQQTFLFYLRK